MIKSGLRICRFRLLENSRHPVLIFSGEDAPCALSLFQNHPFYLLLLFALFALFALLLWRRLDWIEREVLFHDGGKHQRVVVLVKITLDLVSHSMRAHTLASETTECQCEISLK